MNGSRMMYQACWLAWLFVPGSQVMGQTAEQAEMMARIQQQTTARQQAEYERTSDALRKANERSMLGAAAVPVKAKWRPPTSEELAMTSEPRAPGAMAVYLYSEVSREAFKSRELVYRQIKILTEQGRDLANISITYDKMEAPVSRIEARVIQPNGKVVPFKGKIYDRPLASNRQMSLRAKSFTLPDVHVGSIIEYRYWRDFRKQELPRWILNQTLFTRQARFAMHPDPGDFDFKGWNIPRALPPGTEGPTRGAGGVISMQVWDVPPLVVEENMPPPDDLLLVVDITDGAENLAYLAPPALYWRQFGQFHWQAIEQFLGDRDEAARRVEGIVGKQDSAEQKVRKIYEHVRQLGNVDVPESMDEKTEKKCSRLRGTVLEVGTDGCANSAQLQLYFLALTRAAGVPAAPVRVASRAERFFSPESKDDSRIDDLLIAVTIDSREVLLNPAVQFLPYGSLVWFETGVPGLRLSATGGEWFTTPMPAPTDAVTRRKARLALTQDGALEGTVVVRHTGHQATARIMEMYLADEQSRLRALEQELRAALAAPADITVVRQPDWRSNTGILEIEYRVKVRDWALTSGERLLVGIGLFGGQQIGKFVSQTREHPMYFEYPFATDDEIEIALPAGFRLQSAPARQVSPDAALHYVTSVESKDDVVSIRRTMTHNVMLALQTQYPRLKGFYELVRSGDQEQVILGR